MGKIDTFMTELATLGDGRYHYYDGRPNGIGCSDYVKLALIRAGIIKNGEYIHAASGIPGPLADTSRFQKLPWSPNNLQRGDIMWSSGHHVAVWAGDGKNSVWEAAPEATHPLAACGTGVGLHIGHGYYNCGTGGYSWTCLYRIIDIQKVKQEIKKEIVMDKNYNIKSLIEFLPVIQKGSKNNTVKALQKILAKYGWYSGDIDGSAGPVTDKGIRLMQTALGIYVDGIVGPITWTKLIG